MSHFRTITAVVEIDDDSDLRDTWSAMVCARDALEAAGFNVLTVHNEHNEAMDLPLATAEVAW